MGRPRLALIERLSDKVLIGDECWEWSGAKRPNGYGHLRVDGKELQAHRAVFELLRGPIPNGLQLDHLCRNRSCVRPDHLEPVTCRENLRRSHETLASKFGDASSCLNGHLYDEENTLVRKGSDGWRSCRLCRRDRVRRWRARSSNKGV